MNKQKLFTFNLGILNLLLGIGLAVLTVLMQNPLALIMGVLYFILGISILVKKINKKLLFLGIIPLNILFSFNIIMFTIDKNIPEYAKIPFYIGLLIIFPLWLVTFGNIHKVE